MRTVLDRWRLFCEGESTRQRLARLFIAVDELRARLAPDKYPNLVMSDEGHLCFKVHSPIGDCEVIVFPEGLADLPIPGLAVSFPHRPMEPEWELKERAILALTPLVPGGVAFTAFTENEETLTAYAQDQLPPLHLRLGEAALNSRPSVSFFSYFGIYLPVREVDVGTAEAIVHFIIMRLQSHRCTP